MLIERTACAGVLLALDGKRILMDGVCREVKPYPATPPAIRAKLESSLPDALLLTHKHEDHYDEAFVSQYVQNAAGPVLGPADIPYTGQSDLTLGNIRVLNLESRHIGKTLPLEHRSFILQGSKCVWFLGDASPLLWKNRKDLPKPDVMIVPYAYAIGSGWDICRNLGASTVVLLHLPQRDDDPYGLWEAVTQTVAQHPGPALRIPKMGEQFLIPE